GWDQWALPRALARGRVWVFLSPYYKGPLAAPCPVVVTVHDLFFIGYPGRRRPVYDVAARALARLYAWRAAAIVADSEYSRRAVVARLGVSPSKVTVIPVTFGLPALEAMACGRPVVASNRGALPEVVAEAGLLVDPVSEAAITSGIARALRDAGLAADLRSRGLARAPLFGSERTAARVLGLL